MHDISIYGDYGCPFTHRLEAILEHHGIAYDVVVVDDGPIPRVSVDGAELYETSVIAELFVERLGWDGAYPDDALERARHRLAVRQLEQIWPTGTPRLARHLDEIERVVRPLAPKPCMLAFAAAPFFLRWQWMGIDDVLDAIAARPALHGWLKGAAALPAVVATMPSEEQTRDEFARHLAGSVTS